MLFLFILIFICLLPIVSYAIGVIGQSLDLRKVALKHFSYFGVGFLIFGAIPPVAWVLWIVSIIMIFHAGGRLLLDWKRSLAILAIILPMSFFGFFVSQYLSTWAWRSFFTSSDLTDAWGLTHTYSLLILGLVSLSAFIAYLFGVNNTDQKIKEYGNDIEQRILSTTAKGWKVFFALYFILIIVLIVWSGFITHLPIFETIKSVFPINQ